MPYFFQDSVILVFCKAPIAGQVKTRLSPTYSPAQASAVHIELNQLILKRLDAAQLCATQLWCSPDCNHSYFQCCAQNYDLSLYQQTGADLGLRMHHAFQTALRSYQHVILIGSDCPGLTVHDFHAAITALKQGNDVVIAPAEDGGYVLIALNHAHSELFANIAWGTTEVFDATRIKIAQLNLRLHCLAEHWDIDTAKDLKRYQLLKKNQHEPVSISAPNYITENLP